MPYLSVVPAIRTPFGVDCFDYGIDEHSPLQPGDLIRIPFRRRFIPGLVVSRDTHTSYKGKITALDSSSQSLFHFPPPLLLLLKKTAAHTFCSRPTILHSWLRDVPIRATPIPHKPATMMSGAQGKREALFTASPQQTIAELVRSATGRILIITPWQARAEKLAQEVGGRALHAALAPGKAWTLWTTFLQQGGILITTKIGAWLAHAADTVILDEPENDDHKQDELTPRVDARWLIRILEDIRPELQSVQVGLTPTLHSSSVAPAITGNISYDIVHPTGRSSFSHLSPRSVETIEKALQDHLPVIILHPLHGERPRIRCRDCGWQAVCAFCSFPLFQEQGQGRCYRCGRKQSLPTDCPSCGGTDLHRSSPGKDHLKQELASLPGADHLRVVDLPEWNRLILPPRSHVVVTSFSLLGGQSEDIRRQERLWIAWRRLAAQVMGCRGSLIIQGSEEQVTKASQWLTSEGQQQALEKERHERQLFGYPPARSLIKVLVTDNEERAQELFSALQGRLSLGWEVRGTFPVPFRSKTRKSRFVIHLFPPVLSSAEGSVFSEEEIIKILEPFAKEVIIDLDPIAFFE